MTFHLNRRGVREYMRTSPELRALVRRATEETADNVRSIVGDHVEVETAHYTTDRSAGAVTIADPRGARLQATDGALTRAAARVGLEVRAR